MSSTSTTSSSRKDQPDRWSLRELAPYVVLAGACLALYGRSLRYGLIWDDPIWYAQSSGPSLWATLTSLDTYQYYRPLAILLNRALVRPDGVVRHQLAHAIQVGAHTAATLCVPAILRHLGLERRAALCGAATFCLHPYAYQAVAWQAPQQPIATLFVFAAFLAAERYDESRRPRWLTVSLAVYAMALLFQESALPFCVLLVWPAVRSWRQSRHWRRSAWAVGYLALAFGYALIWLNVPRKGGVTGEGLDPHVLAYMLQGMLFPLASAFAAARIELTAKVACALYASVAILLALCSPKAARWRRGLVALILAALGTAPVWLGLSWPYVQVGSRLAYPALLGSSMLWAPWLAWPWDPRRRLGSRLVGVAMVAAVLVLALVQWRTFDRMQSLGANHMASTVDALADHDGGRVLFVNYPDRFKMRDEPYSLGYWGLTLAPVSQDLAGFGETMAGVVVETQSRAFFQVGVQEREAWRYCVDMRGEDTLSPDLFHYASQADAVYITDYAAGGGLGLRRVGAIQPDGGDTPKATLGAVAELVSYTVTGPTAEDMQVHVEMVLRPGPERQEGDTLFCHLLTPERVQVAGNDGDAMSGMLPPTSWEEGYLLFDARILDCADLPPGDYVVTMGCYNRETGARPLAVDSEGSRYWDDEVVLETITIEAANGG